MHCKKCKAYYLSPIPTEEILAKAYDISYYGSNETKFKAQPIERILDHFRKTRALRLSKNIPENARILDIGCGNGNFLVYMAGLGRYKLFGIERDIKAASRAMEKPDLNIKITPLEKEDFPANYFDAVTMFHVFEHLTNPAEILTIIQKILKPGGILYISFPNIESFQAKVFKGKWLHLDPPRHLLFFTPTDFIRMMKNQGYDLLDIRYISVEQNPFGLVQSILNTVFSKREILFERLKGNSGYAPECSKFCIFMQKLFFLMSFPIFIFSDVLASMLDKGATVTFLLKKT